MTKSLKWANPSEFIDYLKQNNADEMNQLDWKLFETLVGNYWPELTSADDLKEQGELVQLISRICKKEEL